MNGECDVDLADFTFNPSSLSFPAGTEVTINLTNSGTVEYEMLWFQWDGDQHVDLFDPAIVEEFLQLVNKCISSLTARSHF